MNRRTLLVAATLSFAALGTLSGCANAPLDAQAKASIRTLAIAKQVELAERPIVFGDKAGGAFLLGGALGSAVEQKTSSLPDQFVQLLESRQINVREINRAALSRHLARKGYKLVEDETRADVVMKVKIGAYGMTGDIIFGDGKRFPILGLSAELFRPGEAKRIWFNTVSSHVVEDINKQLELRPLQDYFNDAALLRSQHEKIADLVAERLARTL